MNATEEPPENVEELASIVIEAALEVHRALGPGYLESVYEEALSFELSRRGVPFGRQVRIALVYKGHPVGLTRLDLLVGGALIVELKAVEHLAPIHTAQAISYLKATNLPLALLLNFNVSRLKDRGIRRVVRTPTKDVEASRGGDCVAPSARARPSPGPPQ